MCTSLLAAENATADGSFLMARSADSSALKAQHFVIHERKTWPEGALYRTKDFDGATAFEYPYPREAMRYTTVPNWKTQLHGAVGFNEVGLGITGTESIFARDDALALDPYNVETGITEDDILDVLLPRCKSAKEAVLTLGEIIETIGAGEGFGVGFADANDLWYLETGTGHQWIAHRLAPDVYFASGNQGRLTDYDPNRADHLGSKTLIEWATDHGFYNPETDGAFNFAKAYTRDDDRDRVYNDPRVWSMQRQLNPSLFQKVDDGRNFPVYLKPEKPITVEDCKRAMRDHFDGTMFDPYSFGLHGDAPWRPISVFRTYEAHVLQVRPFLPAAIGNVIYLCWGMSDLSCFVPFYAGLSKVPAHFGKGTDQADDESVYWKWRKLQTLVMTDYITLAPIVKAAIADFEAETSKKQAVFEAEYVALVEKNPVQAQLLLDTFSFGVFKAAEDLAAKLLNQCFTLRTEGIQQKVFFANRQKKD